MLDGNRHRDKRRELAAGAIADIGHVVGKGAFRPTPRLGLASGGQQVDELGLKPYTLQVTAGQYCGRPAPHLSLARLQRQRHISLSADELYVAQYPHRFTPLPVTSVIVPLYLVPESHRLSLPPPAYPAASKLYLQP